MKTTFSGRVERVKTKLSEKQLTLVAEDLLAFLLQLLSSKLEHFLCIAIAHSVKIVNLLDECLSAPGGLLSGA